MPDYCWKGEMKETAYGYCHCGCGKIAPVARQTIRAKNLKKGDPYKYVANHSKKKYPQTITISDGGCWIWNGAKSPEGYGRLPSPIFGTDYTHRYQYILRYGEIPNGKMLDHRCRVRICCNPEHLEPVTNAENLRRGVNAKITMSDADMIRSLRKSGVGIRILALSFDISITQTYMIARNKKWNTNSCE